MRIPEWILNLAGLKYKGAEPQHAQTFSQVDMRQGFLTAAGNRFLHDQDSHIVAQITDVFAGQDVDGLHKLIGKFDTSTVEAIACALDDAVHGVIGVESSYHAWMTGIMHGQPNPPAAGAPPAPAR